MKTKEKSEVFSEVDAFLDIIDEEYKNKIPIKLRNLFKEHKDKDYHPVYHANIPIEEQNIKKEAIAMIGLLHLNYWCETEEEKNKLRNIFLENQKKYEEKMNRKYNLDDLFKNVSEKKINENTEKIEEFKYMVEYNKPFYVKIMDFLRKLFNKK